MLASNSKTLAFVEHPAIIWILILQMNFFSMRIILKSSENQNHSNIFLNEIGNDTTHNTQTEPCSQKLFKSEIYSSFLGWRRKVELSPGTRSLCFTDSHLKKSNFRVLSSMDKILHRKRAKSNSHQKLV